MKGFSQKWCQWVQSFTEGGNVNIKVNDRLGSYFLLMQKLICKHKGQIPDSNVKACQPI
jgi:hypothetical protein